MRKLLLTLILVSAFMVGYHFSSVPTPTAPHYIYKGIETRLLIHDPGTEEALVFWKKEISRRFEDALVIVVHGNDFAGNWYMFPEMHDPVLVSSYVAELRRLYPERVIVLVCCNPRHHHLKMPGVYHALDSVWFIPDKDLTKDTVDQLQEDPNIVGNIYEFTDQ